MILLDTHVLVWLAEGLAELPAAARKTIDAAARSTGVAVSAISFWEIAMLDQRGRISLSQPIADWRERVSATPGIIEIPIDGRVAIESVLLPGPLHTDPADRLLIATARLRGWRLATRDRRILEYGALGHVRTLAI
ncbi:MAG: VapC toxin family PIN domain ribonuclease [Deltaproteobacteria bacterium]|nr:MAG: VapC toxin family PIN domain ribonuclease [Deltaproteobacteria bacterium]